MAKPGLAQDQTVEEILASIRQAINGDQARSATQRPSTGVMPASRSPAAAVPPPPSPARGGTVTALHGGKAAAAEAEPSEGAPPEDAAPEDVAPEATAAEAPPAGDDVDEVAAPADRAEMHDVIELAIEQALDRVDPDDTRAETAIPQGRYPSAASPRYRPAGRPAARPRGTPCDPATAVSRAAARDGAAPRDGAAAGPRAAARSRATARRRAATRRGRVRSKRSRGLHRLTPRAVCCRHAPMLRSPHRSTILPGLWPVRARAISTRPWKTCCGRC